MMLHLFSQTSPEKPEPNFHRLFLGITTCFGHLALISCLNSYWLELHRTGMPLPAVPALTDWNPNAQCAGKDICFSQNWNSEHVKLQGLHKFILSLGSRTCAQTRDPITSSSTKVAAIFKASLEFYKISHSFWRQAQQRWENLNHWVLGGLGGPEM